MRMSKQHDFFGAGPRQMGLALDNPNARPVRDEPDPDEVRAQMIELLATARAARDTAPWDARRHRFWRKVYPQMSRWLIDPEEARQLCFDFAEELDRIEALWAA